MRKNKINFPAIIWLVAALGAVSAAFAKHASINDRKGGKADIYKLGKNAMFVTNKKPKDAAAYSVKKFFSKL
ncbi:MAG: hypothetical protein NC253_12495 [Ruminococcus sp.]|nr:hypothetical protein [Ruminococcus sp.]MCM1382703.1 hypothetical protein [Muribaculaceae bacterium]